jgi:hypothetical protein
MNGTPRGWIAKRPEHLGIQQLAYHWTDWGYTEAQHHCILVCFFETWNAIIKRAEHSDYSSLAKVLDDHYRQAVFPSDAKANAFVYWLSGPNLRRMYSDCASREEFNRRYLYRFGPLFDVIAWLKEFRHDPEQAITALRQEMQQRDQRDQANQRQDGAPVGNRNAAKTRETTDDNTGPSVNGCSRPCDQRDQANPSRQGQRTDLVDTRGGDINEVKRPDGNSVDAALRRLRGQRPDLHARVLNAELSAHAAMIEAGFRKPRQRDPLPGLSKLRRAWKHASAEERETFIREVT